MLVPMKRNLSRQKRAQVGKYSASVTYLIRAVEDPDFCGISAKSLVNDQDNFAAKSARGTRTIYDSHRLTAVRFEFVKKAMAPSRVKLESSPVYISGE